MLNIPLNKIEESRSHFIEKNFPYSLSEESACAYLEEIAKFIGFKGAVWFDGRYIFMSSGEISNGRTSSQKQIESIGPTSWIYHLLSCCDEQDIQNGYDAKLEQILGSHF